MARQLRQQLDEEVTIVSKADFDPAARRPPGTPPPEAPADKSGEPPPPA
jgi:hypothetical protein